MSFRYYALCQCSCGSEPKYININDLRVAKSCGCIKGGWKGKRSEQYKKAMSNGHIAKKIMPPKEIRAKAEQHHNWKGGIIYNNGYKLIKCHNKDHPHQTRGGYVYEHRHIIEQNIGRYLNPTEKVHHINGDITDNRLENLSLCSSNSDHFKKYHIDTAMKNLSKANPKIKPKK